MKKIIFKNFLRETTIFFLLSCSSVALIVWVIQAVNYLGFVTEDGHGFKIYFLYTLLSLPKIVNEILPFMFFSYSLRSFSKPLKLISSILLHSLQTV